MEILNLISKGLRLSPNIAFKKLWAWAYKNYANSIAKMSDMRASTYSEPSETSEDFPFSYVTIPSDEFLKENAPLIKELSDLFYEHYFNLLGSGWIRVYPGMRAYGIEDYKYSFEENIFDRKKWLQSHLSSNNFKKSQEIYLLIDANYKPIDWQLDFKSGYRWKESIWHKDIQYGHLLGADIRVPWELGRMQHLPYFAYAAACSLRGFEGFRNPTDYYKEFKNQVLCFISSNPPRFGVQWMTAMDVSLRAINWLVAYDLFCELGFSEDKVFKRLFIASLRDHKKFIIDNLEWSSGMRGNHYLLNLAGLLFLTAYLPTNCESTSTLSFVLQELNNEIEYQFLDDGGNFEASSSYHLFACETLMWCVYIINALPEEKTLLLDHYDKKSWQGKKKLLPKSKQRFEIDLATKKILLSETFYSKFKKIIEFSEAILDVNSETAQIGDNDGGFFLMLQLPYSFTDKKTIADYLNFKENIKFTEAGKFIKKNTTGKQSISEFISLFYGSSINNQSYLTSLQKKDLKLFDRQEIQENTNINQPKAIELPDFGLFIYDCHYYRAYVRCGSIGQKGKGGHSHNDQLSLCLTCGGKAIFVDPGTYLYTAIHEKRNLFRSVKMHNTLGFDDEEQNLWNSRDKDDLFWIVKDRTKARHLQIGNSFFVGEHRGFGVAHTRKIEFKLNHISGEDFLEQKGKKTVSFHLHPLALCEIELNQKKAVIKRNTSIIELSANGATLTLDNYPYSDSYGYLQNAKVIKVDTEKNVINWNIEIISI